MIIIFGLGNPGRKYQKTRHNLGQEVVNLLQKKRGFSGWQKKAKLKAEVSKGKIAGKEVLLAKSLTFMNNSGQPAKLLSAHYKILDTRYKIQDTNLWVIHDDIDLPLGKIKISKGRGAAGHKGVESIIKELGIRDFVRFRIGIQPSEKLKLKTKSLEKFVLQKFKPREKTVIKRGVKKAIEAIEISLEESIEEAMQEFNQ